MTRKIKIILGSIIGVPLFIGILGASNPFSNIKSNANSQAQQTTITPITTTKARLLKITVIPINIPKPTAKPTITPRPTAIPTFYIAPTKPYTAPTTSPAPASTQSSSGLSNDSYYTNTAGSQVHSPADSTDGSIPAGATAKCGDGTYSFSQSHRGTCSSHDGVSQWL